HLAELIPLPKQAKIQALRVHLQLLQLQLQHTSYLWDTTISNNNNNKNQKNEKDPLEQINKIMKLFQESKQLFEELKQLCEESESLKSLKEVHFEDLMLRKYFLEGIGAVEIPHTALNKQQPSIRELQNGTLAEL